MIHLYPNCIPVMGAVNIAFYDLEKQKFLIFRKTDLFKEPGSVNATTFDPLSIHHAGLKLLQEHQLIIPEPSENYLGLLQTSSFYKWKHPSHITNAVIELSMKNKLLQPTRFEELLTYLEQLLCKHLFIKFSEPIEMQCFFELVLAIQHAAIHSVQIILPFMQEWNMEKLGHFILKQPKIKWAIIESSPYKRNLENKLFFFDHILKPSGRKQKEQFVVNLFLFSESQLHHNYFNRKLFIGSGGEIKNAPESPQVYGMVQNLDNARQLIDLTRTSSFRKYWYVTKDRCKVCSDCEFRYMCIDNRVPVQDEKGFWYHTEVCNYDPYSGIWKK